MEEGGDVVEGNLVHVIIEICVVSAGNDEEFLVISFELLEGIFGEVAGMGLFTMDNEYRAFDFIGIGKKGAYW